MKQMKQWLGIGVGMWTLSLMLAGPAQAAPCPKDSVQVGNQCVDTHEASVWEIPDVPKNKALINKVLRGQAGLGDLTAATAVANGVVQRGVGGVDNYPCADTGNDCEDIYAVSIPGVKPSASITWFQAQQACGNSGKELLSNAKWQQAAAGTPDPGTDNDATDCNITNDGFPANDPVNTGSRSQCVSRWGTQDMVGNVWEWVADWGAPATTCTPELFSGTGDANCLAGASTSYGPAALIRGGDFFSGTVAGVFAVDGSIQPSFAIIFIGLRCAR